MYLIILEMLLWQTVDLDTLLTCWNSKWKNLNPQIIVLGPENFILNKEILTLKNITWIFLYWIASSIQIDYVSVLRDRKSVV